MIAVTVRGETALRYRAALIPPCRRDHEQHGTGDRCRDDLGDDVRQYAFPLEPFRHRQADGDGRVEMAAGDVPEGVGASQHGQTERKRDPDEPDSQLDVVIAQELAASTALRIPRIPARTSRGLGAELRC